MQNLINDNELVITPYDASSFVSNHYELHPKGTITIYDSKFAANQVMSSTESLKSETVTLTKHGYILEPGKLYHIPIQETVKCTDYTCQVYPNSKLASYGLTVNLTNDDALSNGSAITAVITSTYALQIYPKMALCDVYVENGDTGLGSVPIGAIIAWSGSKIPYGWCLCNGSNGSPDLTGKFILGGTTNMSTTAAIMAGSLTPIFHLVFIMRYK
jgi:hypothetical protein